MDLAIHWDVSAAISVLTNDTRSSDALAWFSEDPAHLVSSLTFAEVS